MKNRSKIEAAYNGTSSCHRLTLKESTYGIIDKKLLEFVSLCSNSGISINSVFLKNKALEIAEKENIVYYNFIILHLFSRLKTRSLLEN